MKSFIKKLANSKFGIKIRNFINIRTRPFKFNELNKSSSISDAFLWRTDNNFSTRFKFIDILNLFFDDNKSHVEIHIYSKNSKLLKIEKIYNLNLSNIYEINSDKLDGLKDFGVFYVFHYSKNRLPEKSYISNRCYIGFSKNQSLHSFVHGNTFAKCSVITGDKNQYKSLTNLSLFKNQNYKIQKYFREFDKNEIFLNNPSENTIKFTLDKKDYELQGGCTILIETQSDIVQIKSNCFFFRPTIFSYKNDFFDVHHG